jgi:uncharacterized protein (TIGR00369 family)
MTVVTRDFTPPARVGIVPYAEMAGMDGITFMHRMMAGEFPAPPICRTGSFQTTEAERGRVVFEGEPSEDFYNPLGTVHGGWISMILDSALGCVVHTMLEAGQAYTTVELKVNFVRPVLANTGRVRAEARIVHHGGRIATSEARLVDARGRLLAHGTSTCMIMDVPAAKAG